jgi:hypothetical protein
MIPLPRARTFSNFRIFPGTESFSLQDLKLEMLVEVAYLEAREVKIHGHMIPIRARIENLDTLSRFHLASPPQ